MMMIIIIPKLNLATELNKFWSDFPTGFFCLKKLNSALSLIP